jgi:DNA polymerase III gamma/tau subunit
MLTDELLTYLFDGKPHILSQPMTEWLSSSRRFTAFVQTVRDKIRKKIRVTQDPETILDLQLELETAYRLLQERALNLAYEPQLAEKVRSADFAITFTTSLTFMLEVTRLRIENKNPSVTEQMTATSPAIGERLADTVCSKLGQLLPQGSNVLLVGVDTLGLTENEIRAAMLRTQQRVERMDPAFFQRYRFRDRAEFFSHYQRLSEILVRRTDVHGSAALIAWVNPQARYPLPGRVRTVLYRSQAK